MLWRRPWRGEERAGGGGGVWAAAIGVDEGVGRDDAGVQGAAQGTGDDLGVEGVGELPAEDGAAVEIEDDGQVEPAFVGGDVGDVADEVGARRGGRLGLGEQVGRRMGGVIGARCFWSEGLSGPCAQAARAHEAGDAIFRAGKAAALEFASHPGASVAAGVTVGVDGVHVRGELRVGLFAAARDARDRGVIAAAGDAECLAKFADGKGVPHGVNQRIPLGGSSESMLMAFFKISRWRRRYSTSRCRRRISPAASARGASRRPFGCAEAASAPRPWPRA